MNAGVVLRFLEFLELLFLDDVLEEFLFFEEFLEAVVFLFFDVDEDVVFFAVVFFFDLVVFEEVLATAVVLALVFFFAPCDSTLTKSTSIEIRRTEKMKRIFFLLIILRGSLVAEEHISNTNELSNHKSRFSLYKSIYHKIKEKQNMRQIKNVKYEDIMTRNCKKRQQICKMQFFFLLLQRI